MPYASNDELPAYVKKLPEKRQSQWRHVVNSCLADGGSDAKCFAMANGVVKKKEADWELGDPPSDEASSLEVVLAEKAYPFDEAAPADDGGSPVVYAGSLLGKEPVVPQQSAGLLSRTLALMGIRPSPSPVTAPLGAAGTAGLKEALCIVKQADGRMRWYARYSNNFKDRDGEIITEAAHKEFVGWAASGGVYPELWLWHTPGTRFGQSDWLDFADGFTHASGLIDDTAGALVVVEALRDKQLGVSHGMLCSQQGNLITKYRSFEISVLPLERASVWTTSFDIAGKETQMAFTPEKRTFLVSALGEDRVTALEANTDAAVGALKQLGVEYKSAAELDAQQTEASKVGYQALAGQLSELTNMVKELAAVQVAQAAVVKELQKPIEEQLDDAFLAKVASKMAAVRPTESAENVTTTEEAKEKAAKASSGGDFFKEMLEKSFGQFGAVGDATPGAPAAGAVVIQ
jgi:cation transport regulator ChaB